MRERSKPIMSMLVQADADILQQAMDYLALSKRDLVTISVVNGRCVDIDTAKSVQLQLPALAGPKTIETTSDFTLKTLTKAAILEAVTKDGPNTTLKIGDLMGIPRNNSSLRGKLSRLLNELQTESAIRSRKGEYFVGKIVASKAGAKKHPTPAITRKDITEAMVLARFKDGAITSKAISDALNIPRGDASVRSKVSNVLLDLRTRNVIRTVGSLGGSAVSYELVAQEQAA